VVFCARHEAEGPRRSLPKLLNPAQARRTLFLAMFRRLKKFEQLIDATVANHGRLDCLINNAGWHPPHQPIDDFSIQDFRDLSGT